MAVDEGINGPDTPQGRIGFTPEDVAQKGMDLTIQHAAGTHHRYMQVGKLDTGLPSCPAPTPGWHPLDLASELLMEHPDQTLRGFSSVQGVFSPQHPTEQHSGSHMELWACQEKTQRKEMLDKPLSLGSANQLGHLGEATFSIQ